MYCHFSKFPYHFVKIILVIKGFNKYINRQLFLLSFLNPHLLIRAEHHLLISELVHHILLLLGTSSGHLLGLPIPKPADLQLLQEDLVHMGGNISGWRGSCPEPVPVDGGQTTLLKGLGQKVLRAVWWQANILNVVLPAQGDHLQGDV
jgi:hypothetical protein